MTKDIIRRIAERGLKKAQEGVYEYDDVVARAHAEYVDIFQHLLDELERVE